MDREQGCGRVGMHFHHVSSCSSYLILQMERIVQARRAEEIHVDLDVSFYDTARNIEAKRRREELELKTK